MAEGLHLDLIFLAATILTLLVAVWRPIVLPRYELGRQPPLGLSWCTASGSRVGLQVVLPLLPWRRVWWCARASAAAADGGLYMRLHLWRRPRT